MPRYRTPWRREFDAGRFSISGYRFHFYSNEGNPREALHIHVRKDDADAKFWLYPVATVAYNRGFPAKVLAELLEQVEARREEIERAWHEYFT